MTVVWSLCWASNPVRNVWLFCRLRWNHLQVLSRIFWNGWVLLLNGIIVSGIGSGCSIAIFVMMTFNSLRIMIVCILNRWRWLAKLFSKLILEDFIFFLLLLSLQTLILLWFSIVSHSNLWRVALVTLALIIFLFLLCWFSSFKFYILFTFVVIVISNLFVHHVLIFYFLAFKFNFVFDQFGRWFRVQGILAVLNLLWLLFSRI